jgi:predicted MFS family arabinose efflux permease
MSSYLSATAPVSNRATPVRLAAAVIIGITLGQMGPITQPFQVGALVDGTGLTTLHAGSLMAVQMASFSIMLLIVARLAAYLSLVSIGFGGAIASIGAFAAMGAMESSGPLYVASAISGAGQGAIFAAALAAGAKAPNPERLYGTGATVAIVIAGAFMAAVPYAREHISPRGVFTALCIIIAALMVLLSGLGGRSEAQPRQVGDATIPVVSGVALACVLVLFGVGSGAAYTFAERVGTSIGMSQERIALIFVLSTFAGASGSGAAAYIGLRWGRGRPLYLTTGVTGLACLILCAAVGPWMFLIGLLTFQIAYTAAFPFQLGAAAAIDRSGRFAAFSGGIHFLAWAIGAQLGGMLAQRFSYPAIGVFSLGMCVFAMLAVPVIVRSLQGTQEAPATP